MTNKKEYNAAYQAANIQQIKLNLNRQKDADIINHLSSISEPTATYLKRLIRSEIIKKSERLS